MKAFVLALVLVTVVYSADEKKPEAKKPIEEPKENIPEIRTFRRWIPADVLRDLPNLCFASTLCQTFPPGESWSLTPFCGHSTCASDGVQLWEVVDDCGSPPQSTDKCYIDIEKTNKTAPFPHCCPVIKCQEGYTLEYPEPATPPTQPESNSDTLKEKEREEKKEKEEGKKKQ